MPKSQGKRDLPSRQDLSIFCWECSEMIQISLIPSQHYYNVGVCMVPQFTEPPLHIVEGLPLGYVVHQQCSYGTSVVSTCYGSVPLLTCCVPYLRLYCLPLHLHDQDGHYKFEVTANTDIYAVKIRKQKN